MQGKITLISPPDFYETENISILLSHITDKEMDQISQWLVKKQLAKDINIYIYDGEPNIPWFLYASSRCQYKYMNLDNINDMTKWIAGYVMGKSDVFYTTENPNTVAVFSHINSNHIATIESFLEVALNDQN